MKISKKLVKNLIYGAIAFFIYRFIFNIVLLFLSKQNNNFNIFDFSSNSLFMFPIDMSVIVWPLAIIIRFMTYIIYMAFQTTGEQYIPGWIVSITYFIGIIIWGCIFGLIWYLAGTLSHKKNHIIKGLLIGFLSSPLIFLIIFLFLGAFSCEGQDCGLGIAVLTGYIYYPILVVIILAGGFIGFLYSRKIQWIPDIPNKITQDDYFVFSFKKFLLFLVIIFIIIAALLMAVNFMKKSERKDVLELYSRALRENNISICDLIKTSASKEQNDEDIYGCYWQLAINNKNLSACDKYLYGSGVWGCYFDVATMSKDESICELIKDDKFKNKCNSFFNK